MAVDLRGLIISASAISAWCAPRRSACRPRGSRGVVPVAQARARRARCQIRAQQQDARGRGKARRASRRGTRRRGRGRPRTSHVAGGTDPQRLEEKRSWRCIESIRMRSAGRRWASSGPPAAPPAAASRRRARPGRTRRSASSTAARPSSAPRRPAGRGGVEHHPQAVADDGVVVGDAGPGRRSAGVMSARRAAPAPREPDPRAAWGDGELQPPAVTSRARACRGCRPGTWRDATLAPSSASAQHDRVLPLRRTSKS